MIDCLGGHTLMRTRLKGVPGYGCCVEFRRAEWEQGRQANWTMERSGEPSLHGVVLFQLSVFCHLREYISHDLMFNSSQISSFLFCFFLPAPSSFLSSPDPSCSVLLNSSHLIFILTTTFFLSLPLCFQVSRGKKRGEEARDGASSHFFFFYTRLIFLAFILSL